MGQAVVAALPAILAVASTAASIALSALNQPKTRVEGPRLQETQVTTSTYGNPIPNVHGGIRIGGNMIWSTDIAEERITKKSGGKGGASATAIEYRYFGNFAIAFAVGDGNGCVSQIFADRKIIYDVTGGSSAFFKYKDAAIRVYMGSETQEPDPLIEADKGVGNVPAHRGMVYVVFENLPLEDFGRRIPQIEAVVNSNIGATDPKDNTTSVAEDPLNPPSTWAVPTSFFDDAKMARTSRQLYLVKSDTNGYVARLDMESNEIRAVIAYTGNPWPPSAGASPGLFVDDAGGGELYDPPSPPPNQPAGLDPLGIYPYTDGKVFIAGQTVENGGQNDIVKVNPFTLRGLKRILSYATVSTNGTHFNEASISFTRQHRSGIVNYTMLAHVSDATVPARLFFFDRDEEEMAINSIELGLPDEIKPECCVVDRDGVVWMGARDESVTDGPNGEEAFLYRIAVDKVTIDLAGIPITDVDVKVSRFDFRNNGTGGGFTNFRCMAYDRGSHSIVIAGGADTGDTIRWGRWDIATEALVAERTFDNSTTEGARRLLTTFNRQNWSQVGVVNGVLFAYNTGDQGDPDEAVWRIRSNDLIETAQTLPTHVASNTYAESRLFTDETAFAVWFLPNKSAGLMQRIKYDRCVPTAIALSTAVTDIVEDSGELAAADLDLTALTGKTLRGYVRPTRAKVRADLEPLTIPFQFALVESGDKIKAVARGGASSRTIPEADLLPVGGDRGGADRLVVDRSQEFEVPLQLDLRYADVDRDYQEGNQSQQRIQDPAPSQQGRSKTTIEIPIALQADEARQAIEAALYNAWVARTNYQFNVGPKHADLEPEDVVTVQNAGVDYVTRLAQLEVGLGYAVDVRSQSEDPEHYASSAEGSAGDVTPQSFGAPGGTELFVLDIPLLRDADDTAQKGSGVYLAFGAFSAFWRAALADRSLDGGATWDRFSLSRGESPWGFLNAAVAAIPLLDDNTYDSKIDVIDETTQIVVSMVQGADDLDSVTRADLFTAIGNANVLIIGEQDEAEIIKYANVTDNGNGTVTIDTMLRGRRGTEEAAVAGHGAGTRCVFVNESVLNREGIDLNRVGVTDLYRATSLGEIVQTSAVRSITLNANDLRPYSVSDPVASPAFDPGSPTRSGTVTVTWTRRTRVGGQTDLNDGIGQDEVPLAEDDEEYEAVLLDKTTGLEVASTLKQGITDDAVGAGFDSTDRTNAGYTTSEKFNVRIYQISDAVGRGFPRNAFL